jgi:hypothetical protein
LKSDPDSGHFGWKKFFRKSNQSLELKIIPTTDPLALVLGNNQLEFVGLLNFDLMSWGTNGKIDFVL